MHDVAQRAVGGATGQTAYGVVVEWMGGLPPGPNTQEPALLIGTSSQRSRRLRDAWRCAWTACSEHRDANYCQDTMTKTARVFGTLGGLFMHYKPELDVTRHLLRVLVEASSG